MDFIAGAESVFDNRLNRTGSAAATRQFGLRLLFDAFTKDGKPGNPHGAKGMF